MTTLPISLKCDNVVPFPALPAKTVSVEAAGPFTFAIWACTDQIGSGALDTIYREELVLVDPDAALEHDCLIVFQFAGGRARMSRWWRNGRDDKGRFGPEGDPRECFELSCGLRYSAEDEYRKQAREASRRAALIRIFGRVVGEPRRF